MKSHYDVLILGGGPAGLTAALYAARAKLSTCIVEERLPGGQVRSTHLVSNYPGFPDGVAGKELAARFEQQAKRFGADILRAVEVTDMNLSEGDLWVEIDEEDRISADAVILATGCEPRSLGLPGEVELRGQGISYCATCDAAHYEGKEVIVIGGGNSAVEESIFLSRYAEKITIVHQFDHLQAEKTSQEAAFANERINFVFETEPRAFIAKDDRIEVEVEHLPTRERRKMEADGVFIFVGMVPRTSRFGPWVKEDKWGYIPTDESMRTNVPGVFAAGDIRPKAYRQITTAIADGTIAALAAQQWVQHKKGW